MFDVFDMVGRLNPAVRLAVHPVFPCCRVVSCRCRHHPENCSCKEFAEAKPPQDSQCVCGWGEAPALIVGRSTRLSFRFTSFVSFHFVRFVRLN